MEVKNIETAIEHLKSQGWNEIDKWVTNENFAIGYISNRSTDQCFQWNLSNFIGGNITISNNENNLVIFIDPKLEK